MAKEFECEKSNDRSFHYKSPFGAQLSFTLSENFADRKAVDFLLLLREAEKDVREWIGKTNPNLIKELQ